MTHRTTNLRRLLIRLAMIQCVKTAKAVVQNKQNSTLAISITAKGVVLCTLASLLEVGERVDKYFRKSTIGKIQLVKFITKIMKKAYDFSFVLEKFMRNRIEKTIVMMLSGHLMTTVMFDIKEFKSAISKFNNKI